MKKVLRRCAHFFAYSCNRMEESMENIQYEKYRRKAGKTVEKA